MRHFRAVPLLLCLALPAFANDTAIQGAGGTIQPMRLNSSIRMVKERVDVKLRGTKPARVRCEFVFKNGGPATTVKMGFPAHAVGDVRPLRPTDLRHFRSWVDGKRVKTSFMRAKPTKEYSYKAWYVKEVRFAAGQTRRVIDTYEGNLGEVSNGQVFFTYMLHTGRNWKGKIGEAVVVIDAVSPPKVVRIGTDAPKRVEFLRASPNSYVRKGSKFVWVMKDFEPEENIYVEYSPKRKL